MNSILLIGNGPSVMDYEAGDIIDKHPCVCRFNAFKINGYEKYVGTKFDFWVTCLEEEVVRRWKIQPKKIYWPLSQQKFVDRIGRFPGSECFPQSVYVKASTILGKYFYPSSGLLAVTYFSDLGYDVVLYGFDFFQREKHHYCDDQPRGTNHKPTMELEAFKVLLERKKVRFLINESISEN
jgi:hypothetical protein